jgi:alpha-glucosidase
MKHEPFVWWKHGAIYQIYPRSFNDSNEDGIGDIPGIIEKLDYLKDLGVHGLWISPIYESPMHDFGYDISDYRTIDSTFGTLNDFKELIKEAHKRDIHIVMDMVFNHTSHEHAWFIESRQSRDNAKADWYVWVDGKKGKYPNNWMAAFGGHAWTWDDTRQQYYLHLFLEEQPDLNWRNDNMKRAFFDDVKFWLDLGVDGFRLDVINYIIKDEQFRHNPYFLHKTFPRRHDMQNHKHDRNRPETHGILQELRSLTNTYKDTMLVGEIYPNEGVHEPQTAASYLGNGENELHLAFNFSTIYTKFKAENFKSLLRQWYNALPEKGWPCHVMSNHDQSRAVNRLCKGKHRQNKMKILAALLLTQRGTPFIYYGEEIGMTNGTIPRNRLADPVGKKYWPLHPGRDRSRTPMQWTSGNTAAFQLWSHGFPSIQIMPR